MKSSRFTTKIIISLVGVDLVFFSIFSPSSNNSLVILVACVLLGLSVYVASLLFIRLATIFVAMADSTQWRLALSISLVLLFLALMQSIGQLGAKDLLAVLPFSVILYLYLGRLSRSKVDSGPA